MPVASAGIGMRSGWPALVSPGVALRRRSRRALRATHSRNRYRTARKPNFSATDTGASVFTRPRRRSPSSRARGGRRSAAAVRRAPAAVDAHAVGRAEVRDRPAVRAWPQLGVAARDARVLEHDVAVAAASDRCRPRVGTSSRRPPTASSARSGGRCAWTSSTGFANARRGAVDHRLAVLLGRGRRRGGASRGGAGRRRRRGRALVLAGADQLRLDAEFAERQALVGVEGDERWRGEDQVLAARVLQQVGAQLVDHLVLDAFVARAVARATATPSTRSARTRARPTRCDARPSRGRACVRAPSGGPPSGTARPKVPSTRLAIVVSTLLSGFIGGRFGGVRGSASA